MGLFLKSADEGTLAAGFFYFERVTHQRLTDWQAEGGGLLRLPWALRGLSALSSGGPGAICA